MQVLGGVLGKAFRDSMRFNGDINVLLFGNSNTFKRRKLKFVERVASIAVYTSEKGNSTAV